MNEELRLQLEKLKPETREQMVIINMTWMRLRKLEQEYAAGEMRREVLQKEISVVKEDHKIQEGKLSKLLLEEKFDL